MVENEAHFEVSESTGLSVTSYLKKLLLEMSPHPLLNLPSVHVLFHGAVNLLDPWLVLMLSLEMVVSYVSILLIGESVGEVLAKTKQLAVTF